MDQLVIEEPLAGLLKKLHCPTALFDAGGKPLGDYLPVTDDQDGVRLRSEAIREIRRISKLHRLDGLSIRELKNEGRP